MNVTLGVRVMRMPTVTTLKDPSCVNVSQDTPGTANSALVSWSYQESTQQRCDVMWPRMI